MYVDHVGFKLTEIRLSSGRIKGMGHHDQQIKKKKKILKGEGVPMAEEMGAQG